MTSSYGIAPLLFLICGWIV